MNMNREEKILFGQIQVLDQHLNPHTPTFKSQQKQQQLIKENKVKFFLFLEKKRR